VLIDLILSVCFLALPAALSAGVLAAGRGR
jgi:hypothetical protein